MSSRILVWLALASALAGCDVDPYCFHCTDLLLDGSVGDARVDGATDSGRGGDGARTDSGACVPLDGATETCNMRDDDCDGNVDEDFHLETDPSHCGSCDNECRFANANVTCTGGTCAVGDCLPGFVDVDRIAGCEYMCPVFPVVAEDCNGLDDDCDGMIDEAAGLAPAPVGICRDTVGTPCAGVSAICATRAGHTTWFCDYPATVEFDPLIPNGIVLDEARCDGNDGDCDGLVDDSFTTLGTVCDNAMPGACRDVGAIRCDPADTTGTTCDLSVLPDAVPGAPSAELCNAVDDDCDGIVDNSDRTVAGHVVDDMVHVTRGATSFWVYRYEASRPDATASVQGVTSARSCSQPGSLPWTRVSYADAAAACAAAGHRLCTPAEWQAACEGATPTVYPYGNAYARMMCNGGDRTTVPAVQPTGTLPMCVSADGARDMSGNVKEWTVDPQGMTTAGTPIYVIRGGSFESPELGLTCQTTLSQATSDTLLPSLGFRCCDSMVP